MQWNFHPALCSILILRTINPQFTQVPVGLVPPANLAQPTNGLSSWSTLNSTQNSINNQSTAVSTDQVTAQNNINVAQQQLTAAQASGDTNAINVAQDKLNIANSNKAVLDYNATILNINSTAGLGAFSSAETAAYNSAIQTIQTSGGSNSPAS